MNRFFRITGVFYPFSKGILKKKSLLQEVGKKKLKKNDDKNQLSSKWYYKKVLAALLFDRFALIDFPGHSALFCRAGASVSKSARIRGFQDE